MAEQRQLIEVLAQIKDERDRALDQARRALGQGPPTLSEEHSSAIAQDLPVHSFMATPAIIGSNKQSQTNGDTIDISSQASTLRAGTEKTSHIEQLLNEYTRLQRNIIQEVHSEQYNIENESRVRLQQRIDLAHKSEIRHLHRINSGQKGSVKRVDVLEKQLSHPEPSERLENNPDALHPVTEKCMKEAPHHPWDGAERQHQPPSPKNADRQEHETADAFWIPQATPDGELFNYNIITSDSVIELPDRAKEDASEYPVDRMSDVNIPVRPPPEILARDFEQDEEKHDETAASEVAPPSNTPLAQEKRIQDRAKSDVSERSTMQLNLIQAGSKIGDEKRKRNATPSHRFRQRRKKKEEEQKRVEKELRERVAQLEDKLRERSDYREEDEATVAKSETSEKVKNNKASRETMDVWPETDLQRDRINAPSSSVEGGRMEEAQWSYLEHDSTENKFSMARYLADQSLGAQESQKLDADVGQEMNLPFIGYSYKRFVSASPPTEASQAPKEIWETPNSWGVKDTPQEGQKRPMDEHPSLKNHEEPIVSKSPDSEAIDGDSKGHKKQDGTAKTILEEATRDHHGEEKDYKHSVRIPKSLERPRERLEAEDPTEQLKFGLPTTTKPAIDQQLNDDRLNESGQAEPYDGPGWSEIAELQSQVAEKIIVEERPLQFLHEIKTSRKALPSEVEEQNLSAKREEIAAKEDERSLPHLRAEVTLQNEKNDGDGDRTEVSIVDTLLAQWTTINPLPGSQDGKDGDEIVEDFADIVTQDEPKEKEAG